MKLVLIISASFLLLFIGCGKEVSYELKDASYDSVQSNEADFSSESSVESAPLSVEESKEDIICIYICGEVVSPGIYELPEGSRVYEAVNAAGGLLDGVDTTKINMASRLTDGQQITVTKEGAQGLESDSTAVSGDNNFTKVNLNTASKDELMTLSGIGESRAQDIIEYRAAMGRFSSIDEIMNISGIGEKMFEKIKDYIEV